MCMSKCASESLPKTMGMAHMKFSVPYIDALVEAERAKYVVR